MAPVPPADYSSDFFKNALRSEIRLRLINRKANACPIAVRLAWHSSGTYSKEDKTGGSNGAGMRFAPESEDGANAGLSIPRDMLLPIKHKFPNMSFADIWVYAGAIAIKEAGGPEIDVGFGRKDFEDGSSCPAVGRLPDASQGAEHLREVFYRMGFNDREIVALSGAHTLGRCHAVRSGFDGPWTPDPLKFDNSYFTNLMDNEWTLREWDGPKQYTDPSGEYMMLPTDIALKTDPKFKVHAEEFAKDEAAFFQEFASAFAKLLALGCPESCEPEASSEPAKKQSKSGASINNAFLEHCMHGSLERAKEVVAKGADPKCVEANSGRTGLHKAAFWGHASLISYLIDECKLDVDGDCALHDAARFGHEEVIKLLLAAGADKTKRNNDGKLAVDVANEYEKPEVAKLLFTNVNAMI